MVTDGDQTYHSNYFIIPKDIKSLCYMPETNVNTVSQLYLSLKKIILGNNFMKRNLRMDLE